MSILAEHWLGSAELSVYTSKVFCSCCGFVCACILRQQTTSWQNFVKKFRSCIIAIEIMMKAPSTNKKIDTFHNNQWKHQLPQHDDDKDKQNWWKWKTINQDKENNNYSDRQAKKDSNIETIMTEMLMIKNSKMQLPATTTTTQHQSVWLCKNHIFCSVRILWNAHVRLS